MSIIHLGNFIIFWSEYFLIFFLYDKMSMEHYTEKKQVQFEVAMT